MKSLRDTSSWTSLVIGWSSGQTPLECGDSTQQIKPNGLMKTTTLSAAASGTFKLGGDLPIHRLGFGAMRITGKGIWGEPEDAEEARRVLRRAVELGQLY
jgi:hypothetical protein